QVVLSASCGIGEDLLAVLVRLALDNVEVAGSTGLDPELNPVALLKGRIGIGFLSTPVTRPLEDPIGEVHALRGGWSADRWFLYVFTSIDVRLFLLLLALLRRGRTGTGSNAN